MVLLPCAVVMWRENGVLAPLSVTVRASLCTQLSGPLPGAQDTKCSRALPGKQSFTPQDGFFAGSDVSAPLSWYHVFALGEASRGPFVLLWFSEYHSDLNGRYDAPPNPYFSVRLKC